MEDNLNYIDNPSKESKPRKGTDIVQRKYSGCSPEYNPISAWGYVGYSFLFAIPFLGQIMLILYAVGLIGRIPVRKYARSYFCWAIVVVLLMFAAPVVLPMIRLNANMVYDFFNNVRDFIVKGFREQLLPLP